MAGQTNPTIVSTKASAKDHFFKMSNLGSIVARVASATLAGASTDIVLDSTEGLNGDSLYTSTEPGMAVIVKGQADADEGKTANITDFDAGTDTITVDTDFTTELADGDFVFVVPPLASEILTNGGHSLNVNRNFDESMGLGEDFLTHNTHITYGVDGSVPFFVTQDTEGLGRMILSVVGGYKKSGTGIHKFRPFGADDGTFTEVESWTAYTQDGDGVLREVYGPLFGTQLTLNYPNQGIVDGSVQVSGVHAVREVGGTGKVFPTGSSNWDRGSDIESDAGSRHVHQGVFGELGGSFGDPLTDQGYRFFLDLNVQITRNLTDDFPLGSQERALPAEDTQEIQVSGTAILEDDTIRQDFFESSTGTTPGPQTTTRLFIRAVHPSDPSRTLDVDIPNGVWRADDPVRQRGRFHQSFTFRGIQSLDGDNAVDTSSPIYEITLDDAQDVNLATAL